MLARFSTRSLLVAFGLGVAVLALGLLPRGADADPCTGPGCNVPTEALVSAAGVPANIECKWELPDMDSNVTGIQYTTSPGHVHDDDMTIVPDAIAGDGIQVPCSGPPASLPSMPNNVHKMIQVKPNLEDQPSERRIQLWMAVDHPNGISNIADVYWKVYHPDGTEKVQVHGTKVDVAQCASLGTSTGPDGSMFEAAVHNGEMTAASVDDINKGMIAKCQEREKALYYAYFDLSKDQMCGEYKIEATAVAVGGVMTKLTNYIDIICVEAIKIDFNQVNWASVTPGLVDIVSGDLIWDVPSDNKPTVKNIGNDGMGLKIHFAQMVGISEGKTIDNFDACFGRSPSTLQCFAAIPASTWKTFDTDPNRVLCANEVGKLDLSIKPPDILPQDIYRGYFDAMGYHVPNECEGNLHAE